MKNSTRKNSSNVIEGVKGIVFFQKNYKPRHITVGAWEEAGKPANCFVYDGVQQLLAAGIPVVDSREVEGRWVRCPLPVECPDTKYRTQAALTRILTGTSKIPLVESEFVTAVDARERKIR